MTSILTLILMLLLGSGLAYLALENSTLVTLTLLGQNLPDVPLFIVIAACILIGLLLALLFNATSTISHAFAMAAKDREIKSLKSQLTQLHAHIQSLETVQEPEPEPSKPKKKP